MEPGSPRAPSPMYPPESSDDHTLGQVNIIPMSPGHYGGAPPPAPYIPGQGFDGIPPPPPPIMAHPNPMQPMPAAPAAAPGVPQMGQPEKEDSSAMGECISIIVQLLSYLVVIVTFPLSLFFCVNVVEVNIKSFLT